MSHADEALALVRQLAALGPLPRVHALHLPPPPPPEQAPAPPRGGFAALELEDGTLGLSYVLLDDMHRRLCEGVQRLRLPGRDALEVAGAFGGRDPLAGTVGFAALNALTRWLLDRAGWAPPPSRDSLGALDPQPGETVGMIGFFPPLVPQVTARGARVVVVELRPELAGEHGPGVRVTLDARELRGCDKVLATGTLLLNGTLDAMLAHCRGASRIALVGPSVGGPPDPLFARGVTLLGGSWVTDTAGFAQALTAGAPTGGCARKVGLEPAHWPGWAALLEQAAARTG